MVISFYAAMLAQKKKGHVYLYFWDKNVNVIEKKVDTTLTKRHILHAVHGSKAVTRENVI